MPICQIARARGFLEDMRGWHAGFDHGRGNASLYRRDSLAWKCIERPIRAEIALAALERGAEVLHFLSERAVSPVEKKIDITANLEGQLAEVRKAAAAFEPHKCAIARSSF